MTEIENTEHRDKNQDKNQTINNNQLQGLLGQGNPNDESSKDANCSLEDNVLNIDSLDDTVHSTPSWK